MKLLMTADAVGGVWTYAVDLARGLRAHGVQTLLAVNGPPAAEPPDDVEVVQTGLPLDWLAEAPDEVKRAGRALAKLARDLRADIVQLNSPAYAVGGRFPVPVVGVQHSCTATWWRAVKGDAPWPEDFGWRFDLARRGLLACDRVVAPSGAFAAAVQAEYGLPKAPAVVWNGRSLPSPWRGEGPGLGVAPVPTAHGRSSDHERRAQASALYSDAAPPPSPTLPPSRGKGVAAEHVIIRAATPPYLFTAGRLWDESKGMGTLDAAAGRLDVPVFAAGPLAAPGSLDAARFEHLRTTGVLSGRELQATLAAATVFVSPSLYEPFGLAVLEAAQLARPLVLSDIPTFRELWDSAAVFVPPNDPDALAAALGALLADPTRRAALGAAAEQRARRYTVEAMAGGMAGVFRSLRPS